PEEGTQVAGLRVATRGRPMWQLDEGFLLRVDVRLDERAPATIVQLGRAFALGLDADGVPEARLTLRGSSAEQAGAVKTAVAAAPLPVRRWVTLDVVHDGKTLQVVVDGRVAAAVEARGAPFQRDGDMFELSPGHAPVRGLVDEVQLFAYTSAEPVDLPQGTRVQGLERGLRFLPTGEPEPPCEVVLTSGEQTERHRVAPGGVLQ